MARSVVRAEGEVSRTLDQEGSLVSLDQGFGLHSGSEVLLLKALGCSLLSVGKDEVGLKQSFRNALFSLVTRGESLTEEPFSSVSLEASWKIRSQGVANFTQHPTPHTLMLCLLPPL